ncbi:hypothetical protein F5890DRAFT_1652378 [Lentinula detonsa]|uniref:Uncharacterized protein n=1 Tax=Lentinula detonsa TaxID=2804962 RepID=A0AA38PNQ1_9AGAR|nr:hypothetical protein F5890DRAFT_1652378 [Lentinula detonsa]
MAQQHFWDQHYDNVLPPLSPRSLRFCDLPYTILSSSPSPDSSPSKTIPHPSTLQTQPLTDISGFTVLEKEPFVQPHGKKGKVWDDIKEILVAEKSITADTHATAVQHKADSLVSYWKNPKSTDGHIKSIAKIFEDRPAYKITIAALMDGIDNQWDRGRNESEAVKEKNQKKKDEDTEGGEAIRHASLRTMGLRKHQMDPEQVTNANVPPSVVRPATRSFLNFSVQTQQIGKRIRRGLRNKVWR